MSLGGSLEQVRDAIQAVDNGVTWKNWMNLSAYLVNAIVTNLSITGIFGETNSKLSAKYQTLITPAGWAFSIWGIIFLWELVFVVAQFLPQFRSLPTVLAISPWWWSACVFQTAWSVVFSQDAIIFAFVLIAGILVSLLGILWVGDAKRGTVAEYWLTRAPFALHAGWVIAATNLNLSVLADAHSASQTALLTLAIFSLALVLTVAALAVVAIPVPNPLIPFVAFWALMAINSELGDTKLLNDMTRYNFSEWPEVVLSSVRSAALTLSMASLLLAGLAVGLRLLNTKGEAKAPGDWLAPRMSAA
jgi:hypothetical protein